MVGMSWRTPIRRMGLSLLRIVLHRLEGVNTALAVLRSTAYLLCGFISSTAYDVPVHT